MSVICTQRWVIDVVNWVGLELIIKTTCECCLDSRFVSWGITVLRAMFLIKSNDNVGFWITNIEPCLARLTGTVGLYRTSLINEINCSLKGFLFNLLSIE